MVELLVVMSIIGILAAITFGVTRAVKNSQDEAKTRGELLILAQAIEQFKNSQSGGDYPWTADGNPDNAENHGELLFKALTGWFKYDSSTQNFRTKTSAEVPANGPKSFIDITKLTYVDTSEWNPDDPDWSLANPSIDQTSFEDEDYAFVDPWGHYYVYLYAKSATSTAWEFFGFHLFSKGPDAELSTSGMSPTTGILNKTFKDQDENIDNLYHSN